MSDPRQIPPLWASVPHLCDEQVGSQASQGLQFISGKEDPDNQHAIQMFPLVKRGLIVNLPSDPRVSKNRNASQLALVGRGGYWLRYLKGWASLPVPQPCSPLYGLRSPPRLLPGWLSEALFRQPHCKDNPSPGIGSDWTSPGAITVAREMLFSDRQARSSAHPTWTETGAEWAPEEILVRRGWNGWMPHLQK